MKMARLGLLSGLLLSLLGCSSTPERDGPPRGKTPDPWAAVEPAPATLERSRYGNPQEYVVFGKRYRVLESASGFRQRGNASWYGQKFHGRRTSSGEPFDMYALTAAHRELPIPCIAQVTNLRNGRSIRVRINDRGPFHPDRVLDLSWAAAVRLDVIASGTAPVEIVVLDGSERRAAAPAPAARAQSTATDWPVNSPEERPEAYYLQVGAFREIRAAQIEQRRFQGMGYPVVPDASSSGGWFRVWLGPWPDAPAAETVAAQLAQQRVDSLLIAR